MNLLYRKYILLTAEIDSLKKDLEITEKILETAMPIFNKEVSRVSGSKVVINQKSKSTISKNQPKAESSPDSSKQEEEFLEKTTKKSTNPNQKSLYKKIAAQTHPDKMRRAGHYEKKYKNNLFEAANEALELDDYHSMCKIAEKLEIEIPEPSRENIDSLTKVRDSVSLKVNNLRRSLPWRWYLESDIKIKNQLIITYINNISKTS